MATDRAKADRVDLNEASRDELVAVPGIGPAAADAILDRRRRRGRFGSVDELAEVPGVGGATLEHARAHLTVSSGEGERGGQRRGEETAEAAQKAGEASVEAFRRTGETVAETARQTGREATDRGAELSRRAGEAAAEGYGELFTLARDNVEGLARASEVVFSRTSELNRAWLSFWREQLAEGTDAVRALTACRSWHEALQVQDQFARASLERAYGQAARSAELAAAMVAGGAEPLRESMHKGRTG